MDARDDESLLTAWRAGDQAAGNALFERHFVAVFRFFASKLGDVLAEDLTQRTFMVVVESRDRVREGQRMRAFMLGVAKNQLLMFLRGRARRGIDVPLEQSCADDLLPSPLSALAGSEEELHIVRALRRIPLEQQMLLELHYWEELSTDEIGQLLGIPRGTVKSRLFRARDELQRALARVDEHAQAGSVELLEQWLGRMRDVKRER